MFTAAAAVVAGSLLIPRRGFTSSTTPTTSTSTTSSTSSSTLRCVRLPSSSHSSIGCCVSLLPSTSSGGVISFGTSSSSSSKRFCCSSTQERGEEGKDGLVHGCDCCGRRFENKRSLLYHKNCCASMTNFTKTTPTTSSSPFTAAVYSSSTSSSSVCAKQSTGQVTDLETANKLVYDKVLQLELDQAKSKLQSVEERLKSLEDAVADTRSDHQSVRMPLGRSQADDELHQSVAAEPTPTKEEKGEEMMSSSSCDTPPAAPSSPSAVSLQKHLTAEERGYEAAVNRRLVLNLATDLQGIAEAICNVLPPSYSHIAAAASGGGLPYEVIAVAEEQCREVDTEIVKLLTSFGLQVHLLNQLHSLVTALRQYDNDDGGKGGHESSAGGLSTSEVDLNTTTTNDTNDDCWWETTRKEFEKSYDLLSSVLLARREYTTHLDNAVHLDETSGERKEGLNTAEANLLKDKLHSAFTTLMMTHLSSSCDGSDTRRSIEREIEVKRKLLEEKQDAQELDTASTAVPSSTTADPMTSSDVPEESSHSAPAEVQTRPTTPSDDYSQFHSGTPPPPLPPHDDLTSSSLLSAADVRRIVKEEMRKQTKELKQIQEEVFRLKSKLIIFESRDGKFFHHPDHHHPPRSSSGITPTTAAAGDGKHSTSNRCMSKYCGCYTRTGRALKRLTVLIVCGAAVIWWVLPPLLFMCSNRMESEYAEALGEATATTAGLVDDYDEDDKVGDESITPPPQPPAAAVVIPTTVEETVTALPPPPPPPAPVTPAAAAAAAAEALPSSATVVVGVEAPSTAEQALRVLQATSVLLVLSMLLCG